MVTLAETIKGFAEFRRGLFLTEKETTEARSRFFADITLLEESRVLVAVSEVLEDKETLLICVSKFPKHPTKDNIHPYLAARWDFEKYTAYPDYFPDTTWRQIIIVPDSKLRSLTIRAISNKVCSELEWIDYENFRSTLRAVIDQKDVGRYVATVGDTRDRNFPPYPEERQVYPTIPFWVAVNRLNRKTHLVSPTFL